MDEQLELIARRWYEAYRDLGGKHDRETFDRNRATFFRLTYDAFVHGIGDREEAGRRWIEAIGSEREAKCYFYAIDEVTPYT